MSAIHGGARHGAGRPEAGFPKKMVSVRLHDSTVQRVQRFADSRGLNWTEALEELVDEYVLVLDRHMRPGRWHAEAFKRPGLKSEVRRVGR